MKRVVSIVFGRGYTLFDLRFVYKRSMFVVRPEKEKTEEEGLGDRKRFRVFQNNRQYMQFRRVPLSAVSTQSLANINKAIPSWHSLACMPFKILA